MNSHGWEGWNLLLLRFSFPAPLSVRQENGCPLGSQKGPKRGPAREQRGWRRELPFHMTDRGRDKGGGEGLGGCFSALHPNGQIPPSWRDGNKLCMSCRNKNIFWRTNDVNLLRGSEAAY